MAKLSGPMLPPKSGGAPKQAVILLHGYGADGSDLIGLGHHWGPLLPDALFIAPNAPTPCGGNPFGFEWFPIGLDRGHTWAKGAPVAREVIVTFLNDLWGQTELRPKDTLLVGFSQGAMMALHVGLSLDEPVMGVVSFSGALIPPDGLEAGLRPKPPVALAHGDLDQVVDPDQSRLAATTLTALGYDVSYHRSAGTAHGISPDMLDFATAFMLAQTA
ncbi:hypothetical protein VW23_006720 [Devosia insulae DS-56]|uniref:Phospholipase/carboxylesterase/thioesterase domain-containing protein n=1 Tax=Devosia insulae DS-56 TaxID=1116389 RepID=A0A1E5XHC7_9HYPH|nr:dienelactone hydrolase family protein [Devosia insulae]OEO27996.1 hypothetical protein VW23_006720 [Devosia insulae DS-56]